MSLKADKVVVEQAIRSAKDMFNGKAVKNAVDKFSEFANIAERQVSELEQTSASQAAQITQLSKAGEEATQKLNEAQAKIAYQETKLTDAQGKEIPIGYKHEGIPGLVSSLELQELVRCNY